MTDFDDDGMCPPCERCRDEPVAVDEAGFAYPYCSGCLLAVSEPVEQDPDAWLDRRRDQQMDDDTRGAA